MEKKMNKFVVAILSLLTTLCLLFGIGFTRGGENTFAGAAETTTGGWEVAFGSADPATYDETTGYATMSPNGWGARLYYNEKLTLNGLTVTIGSANQIAQSRFGFGFANAEGAYTLSELTTVNAMWIPSQYDGQNRLYVNSNHEDGTICYTDAALTNSSNPFGLDKSFVATATTEDVYSFTFALVTDNAAANKDVWSVTIDVVKGSKFATQTTPCTVYFSEEKMPNVLDADGKCYLSAWGMNMSGGDFYIGITTAEEKSAVAALEAYKAVRTSGASVVTERKAAVDAIAALPTKLQAIYQTELEKIDALAAWVVAWNTCDAATYDKENGYSVLTPSTNGQRMYYSNKVKLDGLTVILGSSNLVASSRFGFGLTNDATGYTPELSQLNIFCVPSEYSGQDSLYFNSSNASGTVVYTQAKGGFEPGVCLVDGGVQNRFISAPSAETRYSLTFKYMGQFSAELGDYWEITITLTKGTLFQSHLSTVKVYFLASSLNGALDADGKCYISAWGMSNAGLFYMDVQESSKQDLVANAEAAREAYKKAMLNEEGVEEAKAAYVAAIKQLPSNESVNYAIELNDLEVAQQELANVQQSASVTVNDSLILNYKIKVPEICGATTGTLVSEMHGESVTLTEADVTVDEEGRFVFKAQEVTPQYMTETISLTFTVYNAEGERTLTRSLEYSVREYCENLLANSNDVALQTALMDMLNYGAAAQDYVNMNEDKLANADLSAYQGLATAFSASNAEDVLAVRQGSSVTFKAVSLVLDDKVVARAKFTTTANVANLTASATIGNSSAVALEIQQGTGNTYYVDFADIAPTQYAENIIFTVSYNGSVDAQCRYSVNSYVARKYSDAKCGELVKALYSYGEGVSCYVKSLNNGVKDVFFKQGIKVIAPDGSVTNTVSTVKDDVTPIWQVAQWDSVGDLGNSTPTINNGVYTYADAAKTLSLNTTTGAVNMAIKGSVEYADGDRTQVSTPWPHLLLQQDYYEDQLINLSQMSSVKMQMTYKVTNCDDKMQGRVDADNLHCAQFVWYISLQNRTEGHVENGQYMWFGMILYDNREEGSNFTENYKVDDDSTANTGKMIYQVASAVWSSTGRMAKVGETIKVDFDILSLAKAVFNKAKTTYKLFSESSWEDMYIGTMNFGFEIPGTYDIGVEVSNVGLLYK